MKWNRPRRKDIITDQIKENLAIKSSSIWRILFQMQTMINLVKVMSAMLKLVKVKKTLPKKLLREQK